MVLAHARYRERGVGSTSRFQQHLPETGGEVQRGEDSATRSSDLVHAAFDVVHGVLVDVRLSVESPEILDEPDSSVFLHHREDRAVVLAARRFHHSKFDPLGDVPFDLGLMRVWNPELFHENRLLGFERDLVQ